jgi:NAD(P)H-dependent FMN reductase
VIEIVVGTDRRGSRSSQVAGLVHGYFQELKVSSQILDLASLPMVHLHTARYDQRELKEMSHAVDRINKAEGLLMIIPEYNGSFPGALKHFIDHWKFPDSFEGRPVTFVGLGGRFVGLRAVEQMQQVFSYRDAFLFPQRTFLINVQNILKDGKIEDPVTVDLLKKQISQFARFIRALESEKLDANSRLAAKK